MTTNYHKRKNAKKSVVLNSSLAEQRPQFEKCQFCRQTTFTIQDWKMIFEMEANPPEPTERMKKALQTFNKIIGEQNSIGSSCLQ
ncbi:MAG: hypothetical protein BVN35_05520 [Proteobacteria bacterium ST_bin11]|nr:MAG: hypothetical protein BVN35_05520 [Proteobacteria bacterium ST_bin11]